MIIESFKRFTEIHTLFHVFYFWVHVSLGVTGHLLLCIGVILFFSHGVSFLFVYTTHVMYTLTIGFALLTYYTNWGGLERRLVKVVLTVRLL